MVLVVDSDSEEAQEFCAKLVELHEASLAAQDRAARAAKDE
jgi:hypothetical protein